MLTDSHAFSGFFADDLESCRSFYADTLGIRVTEENGMLSLHFGGGATVLVYPKPDHHRIRHEPGPASHARPRA